MGDGCCFGKSGPRFLELQLVATGHKMFLQGLEYGEQGPAAGNTRTALSRCKGKALVVTDAMADGWGCGDSSPRSLVL